MLPAGQGQTCEAHIKCTYEAADLLSVCRPVRWMGLTWCKRFCRLLVTWRNSAREMAPELSSSNMENIISASCAQHLYGLQGEDILDCQSK